MLQPFIFVKTGTNKFTKFFIKQKHFYPPHWQKHLMQYCKYSALIHKLNSLFIKASIGNISRLDYFLMINLENW